MIQAVVWGADSVDLTLNYQATISELSDSWESGGHQYTVSTTGITGYQLVQTGPGGSEIQTLSSDTGTFNFTVGAAEREVGYGVYTLKVLYPLVYTRDGIVEQNSIREWILAALVIFTP